MPYKSNSSPEALITKAFREEDIPQVTRVLRAVHGLNKPGHVAYQQLEELEISPIPQPKTLQFYIRRLAEAEDRPEGYIAVSEAAPVVLEQKPAKLSRVEKNELRKAEIMEGLKQEEAQKDTSGNTIDQYPRKNADKRPVSAFHRVLILDIETAPGVYLAFGPKNDWIAAGNNLLYSKIISFSYRWLHEPNKKGFVSYLVGHKEMVLRLRDLLDKATHVVGWNSGRFDLPKIKGFCVELGIAPPSAYISVDLMLTARTLGWEYKGLGPVGKRLGLGGKQGGKGAAGWRDCYGFAEDMPEWEKVRRMEEPDTIEATPEILAALKDMKLYNDRDVELTEQIFLFFLPLLKNVKLFDNGACPRCGCWDYTLATPWSTQASYSEQRRCTDCRGTYLAGDNASRNLVGKTRAI